MKPSWTALAFIPVFLLSIGLAQAEEYSEFDRFGLFNECKPMDLFVSLEINDSAKEKGLTLTKERVQTKAELLLRSARLYNEDATEVLFVHIHVVGGAFSVGVDYKKYLYDSASELFGYASTWESGSTGYGPGDEDHILSGMVTDIDRFLLKYLRVNEKACGQKSD